MKDKVIAYLKEEPRARERKNKWRAIVNLLRKRYPTLEAINKETLIDAIQDSSSMDRAWRMALMEDESLRGSDYDDKEMLEQEAKINLGYTK